MDMEKVAKTTDPQGELLTQVDEHNNVIGSISRRWAHEKSGVYYRTIYVLVKNENEQVLIQKRSETKDLYPDCWDLSVGGHVNFGKTYEETAVRELGEELGLEVSQVDLFKKGEVLVNLPNSGEYFNVFEYKLKPGQTIKTSKEEVKDTRWMSIEEIKKSLYIPIVSMIDETVKEITTNYKGVRKVGLMATNGTIESNLYQEAFAKIGVSVITPKIHDPIQKNIMRAIYDKDYGIKETGTRLDTKACKILLDGAYRLRHQGAEVIISGCTEISLAFERTNFDIPIIDPLKITAYKTIAVAMGIEKLPRTNLGEISSPNVLTQFSKIFRSDNSSHNLI